MTKSWIMRDASRDVRKREYLYYLLTIMGCDIESELRNPSFWENYPDIVSVELEHLDIYNMRAHYATIEDFLKAWPAYPEVFYKDIIQMLEKKLNIRK